ncbi:MAG TPA: helix-turn-helix domain-containing protein [Nitrososphaeraceae archaeon]|nr:helix-turn-helix domain-containing protein [Nitrososphaeraceae archaeon]
MPDISPLEKVLISELRLSSDESKTFLLIVKDGKMTPDRISKALQISLPQALRAADSLVKKGMLIEVSTSQYESLHPRFAASNRYRMLCEQENVEFKKNVKIDNIGVALQNHYENARTK